MKIVILDGAILNPGDVDWGPIEALGDVIVYDETSKEQLAERARGADVLLANKTCLRRDDLPALEDARMVGVLATGYNTVDVDAFAERRIPVCNVVAYGVDDVAQHAMALLLELCRHTSRHTESVKAGDWERAEQWCYWKSTPLCLEGLTMGIIGFGSIGRRMGELAHAFGMSVLAHCRTPKNPPAYSPFAFASLDQIFAGSDVISLHCPLTPQTHHLINAKSLAKMRNGSIVLNTARGPLVDEAAAAEALKSGKLRGLGTDVLSQEPPSRDNPLLSAPNTLITPHIAWATVKARQNIINLTAENIRRWQEGHPINVVNGVSGTAAQ
ncbi:D-2-hydroxyacid dehydrogenase [Desulfovibrio sp. PG-178-WT-4]|uniref:D-2-hydroxyacid dehydrogenase n=1 Tax=Desulfovibrio porci TaxID=2605782 RepID=A0A6L5XNC8_9BACT|nr:D-2-hydroxyacid dehydrogenase [Desulfovibrio porci]MDY3810255.1 D-2-hydroxyacid dehydrogenase [Desulfovibrio porci]MSS28707.1 D-2-hydroxyacid dehydrogenase [Desulfovibrio porci]